MIGCQLPVVGCVNNSTCCLWNRKRIIAMALIYLLIFERICLFIHKCMMNPKRILPDKTLIKLTLVFFFLFSLSCSKDNNSPSDDGLPNMIIDTDVGIDDAMAILYLLQYPGLSVDAISISGTGMSHLEPATNNALGLVALAGKPGIPITRGDTTAINSDNTLLRPPSWLMESDTMMGLDLPQNPNPPSEKSAVSFLTDYLGSSEKGVRIVVLGPLTNLGKVLQQNPELAGKIESVIIMGGAVNVPGNLQYGGIEDNVFAEWNIFLDPHAAGIVFRSGVKTILVPLDATDHAPVSVDFYNRFASDHTTPEADFVFGMISILMEVYDTFYFWDPLAAAIGTDQSIAVTQSFPLQVITEEGNENGRTKIDPVNGIEIEVCKEVILEKFEDLFLDVLNGRN